MCIKKQRCAQNNKLLTEKEETNEKKGKHKVRLPDILTISKEMQTRRKCLDIGKPDPISKKYILLFRKACYRVSFLIK